MYIDELKLEDCSILWVLIRESTVTKLQICARYSKVPSRLDDRSPLDREAKYGVTMNDMYDVDCRGSRVDMIHEEGDFERSTGADGKPMQLFQCRRVVSGTEIFY